MNVRGFVFDLDGTLVDSKIDFAAMKAELDVSEDDDVLASIETLDMPARKAALEVVFRYEREGAHSSTKIHGALEFVEKAKAMGFPCAIFTRNANALARDCLKMHAFEMDLVIAREDAPPKPRPEGLHKIARAFGVEVSELLFVGDYIYDLQAGLAAGAPTALYLPTPADFKTDGAHFIFESYQQLSDRMFPS